MKGSLFLKVALLLASPILLILSLIIFWRGHHLPGGGFIGGLVASCAFVLQEFAETERDGLKLGRLEAKPHFVILIGLAIATASAFIGVLLGADFMKGIWFTLPVIGKIGTPVLFDFGVYLVVIGMVTSVLLPLIQQEKN